MDYKKILKGKKWMATLRETQPREHFYVGKGDHICRSNEKESTNMENLKIPKKKKRGRILMGQEEEKGEVKSTVRRGLEKKEKHGQVFS